MRVTNFINGNIYGEKHIFKYHCGANTYFENERGYIELPRGEFFPNMYEYNEPIN